MKHTAITLSVNGQEYALTVAPNRTLLDVLRDESARAPLMERVCRAANVPATTGP